MMVPSTPVHKYMFIVDRGARKTGLDRELFRTQLNIYGGDFCKNRCSTGF